MNYIDRTLGSFSDMKYGKMPNKKAISDNGKYPIFSGYRIVGYCNECNLEKQELIVVARGVGGTGCVKLSPGACFLTNLSIAVLVDEKVALKKYLYYYFRQSGLRYLDSGSAQSQITISDLRNVRVRLPSINIQEKVVEVLSLIDSKIEINKAINDNLQQQAFVLFDKLMIDADNNDCTLSDYAYLNPKRTLAKNQIARSIDMSQLSTSGAFPSGWDMKPFNGGMRFSNGDTLLARITPCLENGKTAFIDFLDKDEIAFGSTEYIVLSPKSSVPPEMMYCLARYPAFVDYAVKNMNGSSGRQRVSTETIGQFQLPKFDKQDLLEFRALIAPMFLKMRYNSIENMRLAKLCDALLPKLISGELDISSIQL